MDDELQEGQFYLFALPWDWTVVGQFVKYVNGRQEILLRHSIYFTRTGRTFGELSTKGLVADGSSKSLIHGGPERIPAQGPKWKWTAKTPWVEK